MANLDNPNGFSVDKHTGGGCLRLSEMTIDPAYATKMHIGDPVKSSGTGRNMEKAGVSDKIRGIFQGCSYTAVDGSIVFANVWPGAGQARLGTLPVANISAEDPAQELLVQVDGDFQAANVGDLANLVAGTGNDLTGRSVVEIDSSTLGSGSAYKIVGLAPIPGNSYGTNAQVLALAAKHELRGGTIT